MKIPVAVMFVLLFVFGSFLILGASEVLPDLFTYIGIVGLPITGIMMFFLLQRAMMSEVMLKIEDIINSRGGKVNLKMYGLDGVFAVDGVQIYIKMAQKFFRPDEFIVTKLLHMKVNICADLKMPNLFFKMNTGYFTSKPSVESSNNFLKQRLFNESPSDELLYRKAKSNLFEIKQGAFNT